MSRPHAVVLAGALASGKTTLARELERRGAAASVLSFGQYVRHEAGVRGLPDDRATLQTLGSQLALDPSRFVGAFLEWAGSMVEDQPVIIEGLRHPAVGTELRTRLPEHIVVIVYLDVPVEVRRARYVHRGGLPIDFDRFDRGPVEAGREGVRAMADLVLPGTQPPEDLASRVADAVSLRTDEP